MQVLAHLPQPFVISLVASSGKKLSIQGMPAINEWQEMESIPGTQTSCRIVGRILFNLEGVRYTAKKSNQKHIIPTEKCISVD